MTYTTAVIRRAEQILGYGITASAGDRVYPVIDGVIYTDLFEGDLNVELPFEYKLAFNGRVNGNEYYNELHVSNCALTEVTVSANWGSECLFNDIKGLLQWLSDNDSVDALDMAGVKSLKIEDFSQSVGSAEDKSSDINVILHDGYGYYIRKPLIIGVSGEQKNDWRHF